MADVIATKIEVGRNSAGEASLSAWIKGNISGSLATKLLALPTFSKYDQNFVLPIMSTVMSKPSTGAIGTYVASASFSVLEQDYTPLITWLNAQVTGVVAPSAPSLSLITAGALTSQGTPSVRVTLVTPYGETLASAAASLAVTDNHELVVASPAADAGGVATGYNVYMGSTGSEKKQNTSPIALGTAYTLTAAVGTSGSVVPTSNGTAATILQSLVTVPRASDVHLLAVVSN